MPDDSSKLKLGKGSMQPAEPSARRILDKLAPVMSESPVVLELRQLADRQDVEPIQQPMRWDRSQNVPELESAKARLPEIPGPQSSPVVLGSPRLMPNSRRMAARQPLGSLNWGKVVAPSGISPYHTEPSIRPAF